MTPTEATPAQPSIRQISTAVTPTSRAWSVLFRLAIALSVLVVGAVSARGASVQAATVDEWPTYVHNNARNGDTSADAISASNAASLKLHWTHHAGGGISAQPVVSNSLGLVFWGSWDGYEHATVIGTNAFAWATSLGQTVDSGCSPPVVGVASTATVSTIGSTPVVFVGGGNDTFFALNAKTGAPIWHTVLGSSPSHFLWSSPAVYNGSVYVGNASFGDCPLVEGQLVQMDATTGAIQHVFNVVPSGCSGGGVWGSPTIDESGGWVYFATGNPGSCSVAEPYAEAVIKVSASDVSSIADHWQVRGSDHADLDFGSTPTLFSATISGVSHLMVGVGNKDGVYYAFDRNAISHGPLWRTNVAHGGACPQCGSGTISPSAWDGSHLYVGAGGTTINGITCPGSLSALDPATGAFVWRHCMQSGPVLGAVSASGTPGVAFVTEGTWVVGVATSNGQSIFHFNDANSNSHFWSSASISNSMVFVGNQDGNLYAFGF